MTEPVSYVQMAEACESIRKTQEPKAAPSCIFRSGCRSPDKCMAEQRCASGDAEETQEPQAVTPTPFEEAQGPLSSLLQQAPHWPHQLPQTRVPLSSLTADGQERRLAQDQSAADPRAVPATQCDANKSLAAADPDTTDALVAEIDSLLKLSAEYHVISGFLAYQALIEDLRAMLQRARDRIVEQEDSLQLCSKGFDAMCEKYRAATHREGACASRSTRAAGRER